MELSLVICTHNPRKDHLRRTLESIQRQTLDRARWELLLVDNLSDEVLEGAWDLAWHPHGRHVREEELGLTPARLRGIHESKAPLIVFVDDDNVLREDYLERVIALAGRHPMLGCIGAGIIQPEFEQEPHPEFKRYMPMLALREELEVKWSNIPYDRVVPWGAGMVVRREVAEVYARSVRGSEAKSMLDRKGGQLNSCGDDEFSWIACEMGLGKGLFPELVVTHLIGRGRVEKDYLLKLRAGHAFSHTLLAHLHGRPVKRPWRHPRVGLVQLAADLARGRFRSFFERGTRYVQQRTPPTVVSEFDEAWRQGVERFFDMGLDKEPESARG